MAIISILPRETSIGILDSILPNGVNLSKWSRALIFFKWLIEWIIFSIGGFYLKNNNIYKDYI